MLSKIKKYRHGFIIAIYFVAYLILFGYLEQRPVRAYHIVHTVFDDMIPFCEIFIVSICDNDGCVFPVSQ